MFRQVQHKRVYEEIVDEIVGQIHTGKLAVGKRLPSERALAEELGVSRSSLREALRTLQSMGYVCIAAGGGSYVNEVGLQHILSPFSAMMAQNSALASDIIEVRRHLEGHMARLAARHATREQVARIYGTILDMQAEIERGGNGIEGDNAFHLEIARTSRNQGFTVIVELCFEVLAESRRATLDIPGQPAKTVDDHILIFEAIRDGREEQAIQVMHEHLDKAHRNLASLSKIHGGN